MTADKESSASEVTGSLPPVAGELQNGVHPSAAGPDYCANRTGCKTPNDCSGHGYCRSPNNYEPDAPVATPYIPTDVQPTPTAWICTHGSEHPWRCPDCLIRELAATASARDVWQRQYEERDTELQTEKDIVNRIWAIFGNPSYEELNGRSIYDLIEAERTAREQAECLYFEKGGQCETLKSRCAELQQRLAAVDQMVHDFPKLSAFFAKHALGQMLPPSCFVCGQSMEGRTVAVQHLELPDVVCCEKCKSAEQRLAAVEVALKQAETRCALAEVNLSKQEDTEQRLAELKAKLAEVTDTPIMKALKNGDLL